MIFVKTINDLYKLKSKHPFKFKCKQCGKIETVADSFRPNKIDRYSLFLCEHCLREYTNINKFGAKYPLQNPKYIEKAKRNFAEKHNGIDTAMHCPDIVKKVSESRKNNSIEKKEHFRKSVQLSWKKKSKKELLDIVNKSKQTKLERYGDPNYVNYTKSEKTKLKKYGDPHYTNHEKRANTVKNRTLEERDHFRKAITQAWDRKSITEKQNILNKIAITRSKWSKERRELFTQKLKNINNVSKKERDERNRKILETRLKRYGTLHIDYLYNYYGVLFDSKPELAVWIYCIDHNIPIIRNPCRLVYYYDNKKHYYEVDFMINNQLIEIKGKQFLNKETGEWVFPYTKLRHNNDKLSEEEKEYYDNLYETKRQCALSNNVKILYEKDYQKYIDYCNTIYPNWDIIYRKDNIYNPSYWVYYIPYTNNIIKDYYAPKYVYNNSISPYNIKLDKDGYTICDNKGVSPFDIGEKNYI